MKTPIEILIQRLSDLSDDAVDAYLALTNEKEEIKIKALKAIYNKKDKEREEVIKELIKLCPTQ